MANLVVADAQRHISIEGVSPDDILVYGNQDSACIIQNKRRLYFYKDGIEIIDDDIPSKLTDLVQSYYVYKCDSMVEALEMAFKTLETMLGLNA